VTLEDIALANTLAHEVLGRSLDELPPQTRALLLVLDGFVAARASAQGVHRAAIRFSRREVREAAGMSDTQLRLHLARLVELEYLLVHRGAPGALFVYELAYDGSGQDGRAFVPGLIDVAALNVTATTVNLAGIKSDLAGSTRGESGPVAGGSRGVQSAGKPRQSGVSSESTSETSKTHSKRGNGKDPSYTQERVVPVVPLAAGAREA
jgi:hypothetical protein